MLLLYSREQAELFMQSWLAGVNTSGFQKGKSRFSLYEKLCSGNFTQLWTPASWESKLDPRAFSSAFQSWRAGTSLCIHSQGGRRQQLWGIPGLTLCKDSLIWEWVLARIQRKHCPGIQLEVAMSFFGTNCWWKWHASGKRWCRL